MKKLIGRILATVMLFAGTVCAQMTYQVVDRATDENFEPAQRTCTVMDHESQLQLADPSRATQRANFENAMQTWIAANQNAVSTQSVITCPVVVHVLWKTAVQNINDNQVISQITVLNQDFGRTNPDAVNTPAAFVPVAANTTIQFCLAQQTPTGAATTGIERRNTTVTAFSTNDNMKHFASGGLDAWDPTRYLNIWVCNMSGGILGYGEFPTASVSQTFGVVIQYNAFGSQTIYPAGTYMANYNLGRTTTHEFSHCFNLFHIWGDDNGSCAGTDLCADTPNQADATFGSPTGVLTDACSPSAPGIMYENYMDYSDDGVMNLFTNNQKTRMLAVLNSSPYNALQTSNGCQAPSAAPPVAAFTQSATSVCAVTGVNFTDASTGSPTSWSWTFPGGVPATSTAQNPSGVTWATAGTKTVTLIATNANGNSTITHTINILALPTVSTSTTASTICNGSSVTLTGNGASTYTWMPGSLSGNPVTVSPTTTTTYTVTGTAANGCTNTATRPITVNPSPTVTTTTTGGTICSGSSTSMTASGANTYSWTPGSLSGTTVTVSPAATTTYTVTGTGANGCTSTATRTITVNPTPTVTTTTTGGTICNGSSTTITAAGATTYTWMPGSLSGTTVTVSPTTTTTYTVTGTSTGCTGTTTRTITVNPSPTITTTTTGGTICSGNSTTITASGGTTYTWMPGSLSGTTVTVSPTTTTTYTVTGTGANGCTSTANRTITVNPSPTVTASASSSGICAGSNVTLSASGANTYNWQPGNHNGQPWTTSPAATTTYTVTGTTSGCTGTATVLVTVTPTPTVTTTTTGGTICNGSSTSITASGATSFTWMPGSLSGTTVTVSPTTTTTYTVTGTTNGCTATATRTITVNPSPTVATTTTGGTICSGSSTTITASGAASYSWMPGSLSGITVTVSPTTTTTYTVTGTGANGCTSTANRTITVNPTPTVTTTTTGGTICSGNSTTITASGATTYSWMPGSLSGTTVTVSPTTTTTYTVTGTATGCTGTTTRIITVNPTPTVTTTATPAGPICSGASKTITASGASTYTWMPGSLSGNPVTVTPATTTTYTVTGTSANGCTSTATRTVTVNPSPTVTATTSGAAICTGSSTSITASGATTYNWMPGSMSGAAVSVTPTTTTTYTVTGTNAAGCTDITTQLITVNALPTVTAGSTANTVCAGGSVTLSGGGAASYTWDNSVTDGVPFNPSSTTTYNVTGTDANGCINTASITVTVNANPVVDLGSDVTQCGGTVTLDAGNAGANYSWSDASSSQTDIVSSSGTYSVTVTDANGCTGTDVVNVTINSNPAVTGSASSNTVCVDDAAVSLTGSPNGGTWSGPGVAGTSFDPMTAGLGSQTLAYDFTDVNGCAGTATVVVSVNACTGVVENSEINNVSILPNPSDGQFTLLFHVNSSDDYTIEIHDVLGQIVYSESLNNFSGDYNKQLDLTAYGKGMYTITVRNANAATVVRAITW